MQPYNYAQSYCTALSRAMLKKLERNWATVLRFFEHISLLMKFSRLFLLTLSDDISLLS